MKLKLNCLLLALIAFVSITAHADVTRLSSPVAENETTETFGQVLNKGLPVKKLVELIDESNTSMGEPFRLQTRIAKVCQKKGCFFIAQEDDLVVRVSFKDYGFFIPTDASGKQVELMGELVKKNLSTEQADHFNKDLGGSGTFSAGDVYEIVASGIEIPKSKSG